MSQMNTSKWNRTVCSHKKNEEDVDLLIWNKSQAMLLKREGAGQCRVYCFCTRKEAIRIYVFFLKLALLKSLKDQIRD